MPVEVTTTVAFGQLAYLFEGTPNADIIKGFNGQQNIINGNAGDDILSSGKAPRLLVLNGGEGNDTLRGSNLIDNLDGGPGVDYMVGGPGGDQFWVDNVGDVVVERARWDVGGGNDVVRSTVDYSIAGTHVETLLLFDTAKIGTGNALDNRLQGNDENNTLDGGRGIDTLTGGRGDDTYILRHKDDTAVEVGGNARQKTLRADEGGHDTVLAFNSFKLMLGIEDIMLQDVLGKTGEAVSGLTAIGNNLDNRVVGNATDNNLNGRTGNDTLTGGAGTDDFIFSDALGARHADRITDFASGEDRIVIKGALVNIGPGPLDANAFHLGTEAATADHRFLFDGTTLRYDADGSGAGAAIDVAYFDGTPTLVADDIFIA